MRSASARDNISILLPVLWLITGAQPYFSTVEHATQLLYPYLILTEWISFPHLHLLFIERERGVEPLMSRTVVALHNTRPR